MLQPSVTKKKAELEELNLSILEKEAIERALRRADGNVTRAAEYWVLPVLPFTGNWINWAYERIPS